MNGVETWSVATPKSLAPLLPSWSPNAYNVLSHLVPAYQEALGDALYHCTQAGSKH